MVDESGDLVASRKFFAARVNVPVCLQPAKPVEAIRKLKTDEEELEISDVSAGNKSDSTQ